MINLNDDYFNKRIAKVEHGFKHIVEAGNQLIADNKTDIFSLAKDLYKRNEYQARMLATYLLGTLSEKEPKALKFLHTTIAKDDNWRVQEMLAKAFDSFCKERGYEKSIPVIKEWLNEKKPMWQGL